MAGTTQVVKRQWPLFTRSQSGAAIPFDQAVFDNIIDIITDLEVLRAHDAQLAVLLDADTTNTTYVGDANAN